MVNVEELVEKLKKNMLAPEIEIKPKEEGFVEVEIRGVINKNVETRWLKEHRDSILGVLEEHGFKMSLDEENKLSYKGGDEKKKVYARWEVNPLEMERLKIVLNNQDRALSEQLDRIARGYEKPSELVKLTARGVVEEKHLDLLKVISDKKGVPVEQFKKEELAPLIRNNLVVIENGSARLKTSLSLEKDLKEAREMVERVKP